MQYTNAFGTFLVGLLAVSEVATAVPTGPPGRHSAPVKSGPRGQASLKQVRNAAYNAKFSRHGALAREKAYLKYNAALPEELTTAVSRVRKNFRSTLSQFNVDVDLPFKEKRATGTGVPLPEEYDVEYLTAVQIGTPPQNLNLDIDTGSSDLWVYSSETPASEVNGQAVYNPNASNTSAKQAAMSWSISYGDGSNSKGEVYYDTVSIGALKVENMAVEVATEVSTEFTADTDIDGLLGLGFSRLNTVSPTQQKTFLDKAEDQLDAFLFTCDLKAGAPGTYNFGFIDPTLYTGDISYTTVDSSDGYWMFNTSGYQIGDKAFESTSVRGIADTGTTLLMLPDEIVDAYYAQVSGSSYDNVNGGYVFPCDVTPPDFTLGIEEGRIVIPGSYINYSPLDSTNTTCYGGIQSDADIGFAIFGDVALKAAFVVFESGPTPMLGWASKNL